MASQKRLHYVIVYICLKPQEGAHVFSLSPLPRSPCRSLSRAFLVSLAYAHLPNHRDLEIMRGTFLVLVCALTLSVNVVLGSMPDIVARFEETTDLWKELHHFNRLPGHYSVPTNTQTTNSWIEFVQTNGGAIIEDTLTKIDRRLKGGKQYKAIRELKAYANDPVKVRSLYVTVQAPIQLADEIILQYANHLSENPQFVAIYDALKRIKLQEGIDDALKQIKAQEAGEPADTSSSGAPIG